MASSKGRIFPAERLGKQKTSWQIITVIFFWRSFRGGIAVNADEKIRTWGVRLGPKPGPLLVWITVALTIYSALGFTWRNRELISPDQ